METVQQQVPPRKRALAGPRQRSRGAKRPPSPLRRANAEAVARLLLESEPVTLDPQQFKMWQIEGITRREALAAIDDLAQAGRVSIQIGRYGEREITLTDSMREWRAAGYDVEEVPA